MMQQDQFQLDTSERYRRLKKQPYKYRQAHTYYARPPLLARVKLRAWFVSLNASTGFVSGPG